MVEKYLSADQSVLETTSNIVACGSLSDREPNLSTMSNDTHSPRTYDTQIFMDVMFCPLFPNIAA